MDTVDTVEEDGTVVNKIDGRFCVANAGVIL